MCSQHQDSLNLSDPTMLAADVLNILSKPSPRQSTVMMNLVLVSLLHSLLTDAMKQCDLEAYKLAVSLPAQSNITGFRMIAEWIYLWKPDFFFFFFLKQL